MISNSSCQFAEAMTFREEPFGDLFGWTWPKTDHGAWGGPKEDWEESHQAMLHKYVKNWDVVVQAGGNCGAYPALLAKMFKTVYTFEPDPLNFFALVQNTQYDNIVKIQGALGEAHGMISVQRMCMENVGMHKTVDDETGIIPQFCIDDLDLKACDLIMLDVEGSEFKVLAGSTRVIMQFSPVIVCERPATETIKFLEDFGYELKEASKMDSIFVRSNGE